MSIYTDTERVYKELISRGFTEDQATAIVDAIRSLELSQFATKSDIEIAIKDLRSEMERKFSEVDQRFTDVENRIDKLGLQLTVRLGSVVAILLAIFKFLIPGV